MADADPTAMTQRVVPPLVESPCIRRCTLDEGDLCVGCGRTLGEILEWAPASRERKLEIRSIAASRLEQRRR